MLGTRQAPSLHGCILSLRYQIKSLGPAHAFLPDSIKHTDSAKSILKISEQLRLIIHMWFCFKLLVFAAKHMIVSNIQTSVSDPRENQPSRMETQQEPVFLYGIGIARGGGENSPRCLHKQLSCIR